MRNSSLVEGSCAENSTGLKPVTEAVDVGDRAKGRMEEAAMPNPEIPSSSTSSMVGERSSGEEGES